MVTKIKKYRGYGVMGVTFDDLFDDVEKLTKLEASTLHPILKKHKVHTVLDCACGTGIQALGLTQLHYDVSASDISRNMVYILKDKAAKKHVKVNVKTSNFLNLKEWRKSKFDAVINCGHSTLYVDSLKGVETVLQAMKNVTKPGGIIVVSIRNYLKLKREGKTFLYRRMRVQSGIPEWVYDIRIFDKRSVNVHHVFTKSVRGRLYTKFFNTISLLITPQQLRGYMQSVGLSDIKILDLITRKPYTNGEWILAIGTNK